MYIFLHRRKAYFVVNPFLTTVLLLIPCKNKHVLCGQGKGQIMCFSALIKFSAYSICNKPSILVILGVRLHAHFCVGYIDGIPDGVVTLYFVSIRPGFHYLVFPFTLLLYVSILSLCSFCIFSNTLPRASLFWSKQ